MAAQRSPRQLRGLMGEFAAVARDMEAELVEVSHSAARDSGMEQLRIIRWSLELDRLYKCSAERWRTNYLNDVRPWLYCTALLHIFYNTQRESRLQRLL